MARTFRDFLIESHVGDTITHTVNVSLNGVAEENLTGINFRVNLDTGSDNAATIDDTDLATGSFDFEYSKDLTDTLDPGSYPMGIKGQLPDPGAEEYTIGSGLLILREKRVE